MERRPVTVTELNGQVKTLLDSDPRLADVLVRVELSNYKIYSSGHHYFTLKDAGSSLRCVMFRGEASRLRFRPDNGMGVTCAGRVSVYPRDGAYQLYVAQMRPEGAGDLYLAYEQLKARLQEEGLFDREHKKPIPAMPERIAVITSGSGAAVRDVIRILGKRWPLSRVIVLPVRVQGTEAPAEIVGAIRYANRYRVADLIITGRGGGSIEDLWAFNDERVARAIYDSEIPVISAVGHEPDVTISDFVADLRAATPSNAAELAVPDRQDVEDSLLLLDRRGRQVMAKKLESARSRLQELSSRPVMRSPLALVDQRREDLDRLSRDLLGAQERILSGKKQEYVRLAAALDAMSPLKVLSRGFSVTMDQNGHILRDASAVAVGDAVHIKMERGGLDCRVEHRTGEET
ncbi:MAG: exodeoxyribonuclease VII large subunit [Oscillospiraceae bacterium]|nr:exodeoxyribonuclease VII large subunit [Oscillospiraceae bacterium]